MNSASTIQRIVFLLFVPIALLGGTGCPASSGAQTGAGQPTTAALSNGDDGSRSLAVPEGSFCSIYPKTPIISQYFGGACPLGTADDDVWRLYDCEPSGILADYLETCPKGLLRCSLFKSVMTGELDDSYRKLFRDMLRLEDRALVKRFAHGSARGTDYLMGSCLGRSKKKNGWSTLNFGDMLTGVGATASPEQTSVIDPLVVDERNRNELLGERAQDKRRRAALAYFWSGAKSKPQNLMGFFAVDDLHKRIGHGAREVSIAALAHWGSDAAVSVCAENLPKLRRHDLKACVWYLAYRGKVEHTSAILRQVERADGFGIQALGLLGTKEAKDYLLAKVESAGVDGSSFSQLDVALTNTGDDKAWNRLQSSLTNKSYSTRAKSLYQLGFLRGEAVSKCIAFLREREEDLVKSSESVRPLLATMRLILGDKSTLPAVIKSLNSPDREVRASVVRALGANFGDFYNSQDPGHLVASSPELIPALVQSMARESNDTLRTNMAIAALNIRGKIRSQ